MSISREKLKRISSCFDRLHTTFGCLREHIEAIDDKEADQILTDMEYGTLAPMRRLRKHLAIPYNWQESQEVGNDGPSNTDSDRELLCAEGS